MRHICAVLFLSAATFAIAQSPAPPTPQPAPAASAQPAGPPQPKMTDLQNERIEHDLAEIHLVLTQAQEAIERASGPWKAKLDATIDEVKHANPGWEWNPQSGQWSPPANQSAATQPRPVHKSPAK